MAKNSLIMSEDGFIFVDAECIATQLELLTEGFTFTTFKRDKRIFITVDDALEFIKNNPRKLRETPEYREKIRRLEAAKNNFEKTS